MNQPPASVVPQTLGTNPSIANRNRMIESDLDALKRGAHGIRRRLHSAYGLDGREMNLAAACIRSNDRKGAREIFLAGLEHLRRLAESH